MVEPIAPERIHIVALPPGYHTWSYAILADDSLAILATDHDIPEFWPHNMTAMIDTAKVALATIFVTNGTQLLQGPSFPLEAPYPAFDRCSDGSWVVAATRTTGAANGRIIDPNGVVTAQIMLGDGVEHLQIDSLDRIWVGWFDEGVFGNSAWSVPQLEHPPSSYGLGCFSREGEVLWVDQTRDIADCFAVNVAHDQAWYSAYTEFFITRSYGSGDGVTWKTQLHGVAALAVDFPYVAAIGGYRDRKHAYKLYQLDDVSMTPRHIRTGQIAFPTHHSFGWLLRGRNGYVHDVSDGVWRRWALADL